MPRYTTYWGYKRNRRQHEEWAAKYKRGKEREQNQIQLGPRMQLVAMSWMLCLFALFSSAPWVGIAGFFVAPIVIGFLGRSRQAKHSKQTIDPKKKPRQGRHVSSIPPIDVEGRRELVVDLLIATRLVEAERVFSLVNRGGDDARAGRPSSR